MAQSVKIELITNELEPGANLTFIATIYDAQMKSLDGEILITLNNIEKGDKIEQIVNSKKISSISLGEKASPGQWDIKASYEGVETKESFFVKIYEEIQFELEEESLKITNIGNIVYSPSIRIAIGDTIGNIKEPKLEVGESISYRLIAPEGTYKIIATDEKSGTTFTKNNVQLIGKGLTGKAIGAIDERTSGRNSLTGGISPSEESDEALLSYIRGSKFVYVFILVVFGTTILIAIERRYRKKVKK